MAKFTRRVRTVSRPFPTAVFSRAPSTSQAIVPVRRASSGRLAALKAKLAGRLSSMRSRASAHAKEKREMLTTVGGGVALGLGRRFLPDLVGKLDLFGVIPAEATIGVAGYLVGHYVNNPWLDALTTAALTVGGFKLASGATVEGVAGMSGAL